MLNNITIKMNSSLKILYFILTYIYIHNYDLFFSVRLFENIHCQLMQINMYVRKL